MMKRSILLLVMLLPLTFSFAQNWKELANDFSVNFYDVCKQAELHFDTIETAAKGSGYKGFQRWKYDNEYKYYPTGDRSQIDPYFVKKQFDTFRKGTPASKSIFQTGWEELGPTSPGQITEHYAFGMGRIESFYVNPNNMQTLYFGTLTGGFWKSLDGGSTWAGGSTDFLAATGVNTIAVSPSNPDSVLININNSQNYYTHGIYRSIDGGDSWVLSNFNPTNLAWGGLGTNNEIYKISYHPTIPNLIFIGTNTGLYRSNDNLGTWSIPMANNEFTDIEFHPTNPNIVYAYAKSTQNDFYVSTDAGITFTMVPIPGSAAFPYLYGNIAVSASCPDCVYYFAYDGFWKSTDSGVSFSLVSNPNLGSSGFAVSDLDDTKMMAGVVDASASSDGGLNFNQVTHWDLGNTNGAGSGYQNSYNTSTDYIHADVRAADCINGVFYAATDGFLVNSTDNGATWNILSEDIGIRMNYNLGVSQSNHDRTICGSQDNGISVHTENGWVEMFGADGLEGIIHPLNDDIMIGSAQNGYRVRTLNGGQTTALVQYSGGGWNAPLFYNPNDHMQVYSLGTSLLRSDKFGSGWTTVGSPSFTGVISYGSIAENNSNLIVATSGQYIELSDDGGSTWADIKGTLPSYSITDVVFDPNDDSTIVVTYGNYQLNNSKVFITHNLGTSWQNITYNLGDMPVRSVVIDYTDSSTIYLGTEIGLYKKSMSAVTWSLYNTDLPNTSIREMDIMWGSNTLRATTWGRGLWEYSIDGRIDYPAITKTAITDNPTENFPGESFHQQLVYATILYDSTITSAYVKWSADTTTFGNVIPMTNVSGNDWVSNTALPDSSAGTKIYFKVFAVGVTGDTTETYKFMYTIQPFEYCAGSGNIVPNLSLTNVTVANVNNNTASDSYTYYGNDLVSLLSGSTYSITLSGPTNTFQGLYFFAWIDFNGDRVFDANEEILSELNANSSTVTGSFVVPTTAILEDTLRLRVETGTAWAGYVVPCDVASGEVEDYPVWISCGTSNSIDTLVACDSLTWIDGNTYTASNALATDTLLSLNGCDSIVTLNLTINNPTTGTTTDIISTCDSYTWIDGNTYTTSTTIPSFTLINAAGCDSIVSLDLTINNSTVGTITDIVSTCDSYTWIDGNTYTTSTTIPSFTLINAAGCDSIVSLDLTINNSTVGTTTDVIASCAPYTWVDGNTYTASTTIPNFTLVNAAGCDSIVALDLTINNSITEPVMNVTWCGEYTSPSGNYLWNSSGVYYDTLQTVNGCDSILPINLILEAIDTNVTNVDTTLISMQLNAQYQWINCIDGSIIPGATSQTFVSSATGNYAVIINYNNCIDTSSCANITVGLGNPNQLENFKVYPNPTNGSFNIELPETYSNVTIEIMNSLGQTISKETYNKRSTINLSINEGAGLYLIRAIFDEHVLVIPLVKK